MPWKKLLLHSAGNENSETILCCGYNPYIDYKLKEAEKVCAALDVEISRITSLLQSKYHLSEIPDSIKKVSPEAKTIILDKLKKLKELTESKKKIEEVKVKSLAKLYSEDEDKLSIEILKHTTPVVFVQILRRVEKISGKTGPKVFNNL